MGLADSYPPDCLIDSAVLEEIEHLCVEWRWKLKPLSHRLRQVHGDFHPWNILFGDSAEFRLLDRSRGEFGDPADDVACITSNFLFFSLQRYGRLQGPLRILFERFWARYLERTGDFEMLRVVPPFFAFSRISHGESYLIPRAVRWGYAGTTLFHTCSVECERVRPAGGELLLLNRNPTLSLYG